MVGQAEAIKAARYALAADLRVVPTAVVWARSDATLRVVTVTPQVDPRLRRLAWRVSLSRNHRSRLAG